MSESNPEDQAAAIKAALFAGNKIEAIKLYREQTKLGLAEAKAAVEKLEAELCQSSPESFTAAPAKECGVTKQTPEHQAAALQTALFAGRKIEAIRIYRGQRKVGLAEAKAAVEQLEAELRQSSPGSFTAAPAKGCGVTMVMAVVIVAALWRMLA